MAARPVFPSRRKFVIAASQSVLTLPASPSKYASSTAALLCGAAGFDTFSILMGFFLPGQALVGLVSTKGCGAMVPPVLFDIVI